MTGLSIPKNLNRLGARILSDLRNRKGIIGIDGVDGIGKTTLAKLLGEKLHVPTILLDDHLNKNCKYYVDALNQDVAVQIAQLNNVVVIEGVCLLAVAERFGFEINTHIYLKRIHLGMWADGNIFGTNADPSDVISKEEGQIYDAEAWFASQGNRAPRERSEIRLSGLRCELINYHYLHKPHNKADLVYEVEHT